MPLHRKLHSANTVSQNNMCGMTKNGLIFSCIFIFFLLDKRTMNSLQFDSLLIACLLTQRLWRSLVCIPSVQCPTFIHLFSSISWTVDIMKPILLFFALKIKVSGLYTLCCIQFISLQWGRTVASLAVHTVSPAGLALCNIVFQNGWTDSHKYSTLSYCRCQLEVNLSKNNSKFILVCVLL